MLRRRKADVVLGVYGGGEGYGAADADGAVGGFSGVAAGGRLEISAWGELAAGNFAAGGGEVPRHVGWHDGDCNIVSCW